MFSPNLIALLICSEERTMGFLSSKMIMIKLSPYLSRTTATHPRHVFWHKYKENDEILEFT